MAVLILCMPMSYRAGTDFSHPHAFFQVFIDAATGHSHHDAGELVTMAASEQVVPFSPFVPPDVPLQQPSGNTGSHTFSIQADDRASDAAALTALTAPQEQASGIPALSLMVFLLLAVGWQRAIWALSRTPRGITPAPELPPPRPCVV